MNVRRALDFGANVLSLSVTLSATLPFPDLETSFTLTSPFTYTVNLNNYRSYGRKSDTPTSHNDIYYDTDDYNYDKGWDLYYSNQLYGSPNYYNYSHANSLYKRSVNSDTSFVGTGYDNDNALMAEDDSWLVMAWANAWRERKDLLNTLDSAMGLKNLWWSHIFSVPVSQLKDMETTACIERAVCEVAAFPHHDHDLVGDMLNGLLNVGSTLLSRSARLRLLEDGLLAEAEAMFDGEGEDRLVGYSRAQLVGENDGDCGPYAATCPFSVFDIRPHSGATTQ